MLPMFDVYMLKEKLDSLGNSYLTDTKRGYLLKTTKNI